MLYGCVSISLPCAIGANAAADRPELWVMHIVSNLAFQLIGCLVTSVPQSSATRSSHLRSFANHRRLVLRC